MYLFNKITVNPQLPKRIEKLSIIANNLWWSWNSEFLRLFKTIDIDLWENIGKNPVKFLKLVPQEKLEEYAKNTDFLKEYDRVVNNFENYMNSRNTLFTKKFPDNKNDLIAYFSAEYGLDEIMQIYSGGLGILSGDHLKAASDLGIPLVGVGLLYKRGYFHQVINPQGRQENVYRDIELENLPMTTVKNEFGDDLIIESRIQRKRLFLKAWQVNVGRVKLYLLDSDIEENLDPEFREITKYLYGGDQETRIRQEIVLGMAGTNLLEKLGLNPTVYHMNEGHSAFLILELSRWLVESKKISFRNAISIVASKTVFTTHTPVPAGNDIFPIELMEKYFKNFWPRLGIEREEFLKLGMNPKEELEPGFNMGIFALKIAGKKNGVSKLHGGVSRELFGDIWPDIAANESPIGYVTNGIHTCTWLAPTIKELYNKYLAPYWQDNIHVDRTWEKIRNIPNKELWDVHFDRKVKLLQLVRKNTIDRLRRNGMRYEEIMDIVSKLNPNALTIGFARRFATYKRGTLIFRDLERITEILNNSSTPVQLIFAGKAHPRDVEGQDLIRQIHEISMKPQFKGKIFLLEDYDIAMSRYLISGVDVWLNNPRRPMEASGTSGQKASVNGVLNFSILDGWWVEGYNKENGWIIGQNKDYDSYEIQDNEDCQSIYDTLENKIIPAYYSRANGEEFSSEWVELMKNSIISTGGKYSTARMLMDYTEKMYLPLCNLYNKYYSDLENVIRLNEWVDDLKNRWDNIKLKQLDNLNNITIDAGNNIEVKCEVDLQNINPANIEVQVYSGKVLENGTLEDIQIKEMEQDQKNSNIYKARIALRTGGDYGYTFRVMPKHEMVLESQNLNLVKWITEEMQKGETEKQEIQEEKTTEEIVDEIVETIEKM
ncbi:MAG: glycosyltransferase family 1 protein [Clostridia bacterium]|nr:glycosyltransferase family 1 protein [Clostridia bacterium]